MYDEYAEEPTYHREPRITATAEPDNVHIRQQTVLSALFRALTLVTLLSSPAVSQAARRLAVDSSRHLPGGRQIHRALGAQ